MAKTRPTLPPVSSRRLPWQQDRYHDRTDGPSEACPNYISPPEHCARVEACALLAQRARAPGIVGASVGATTIPCR